MCSLAKVLMSVRATVVPVGLFLSPPVVPEVLS